jgi:dephospho-CoA kinase
MIIGITGWFAAGKDTVCDHLEKKGFVKISLSDIIREHCTKEGNDHTRDNLREMGNRLREKYGPDYLANEALKRMQKNGENANFVVPSVRQTAEVKILREDPNFHLWEVYAPQKTRFERLLARARSEDEKTITFEEFVAKEEIENGGGPNCQQVDKVIELVDKKIDNSGDLDLLYRNIDLALEDIYAKTKKDRK